MENSALKERIISEFIAVAAEYCRAFSNLHQFTPHDFASYSLKILPLLYLKASGLPDYDNYDRDAVEKFVAEEEWTRVKLELEKLFGKYDRYIEPIGRFGKNEEGSISENLADVYQDLKDFTQLIAFGIDDVVNEAVGEVKQNFTDYWGQRVVNSMKIIHSLYVKNKLSKEPIYTFPEE
jgi:hypothetical protein